MSNGQKVVATAEKYLWVKEVPNGSNRSPKIDEWQRRWGMLGQPWCGMFVDAIFAEAGVDDAGISHPATAVMAQRIRDKGLEWDMRGRVPAGAIWVQDRIHTAIVVKDEGNGWLLCIDGNSSNRVRYTKHPRRAPGVIIGVPPAIKEVPKPEFRTVYYFDDLKAEPYVYRLPNGKVPRWKVKANAQRVVNELVGPKWNKLKPRVVKLGSGGYAIQLGDVRTRGFSSKAKRDAAYNGLVAKNGTGRYRKYSKRFKV